MTLRARTVFFLAATFLAGLAGVLVGRTVLDHRAAAGTELHTLLHERLDLDERQMAQLEMIERRFAVRRKALELELRSDNAQLAGAIEAEHGYGPKVAASVDRSHVAMGQLQKETLAHIFAMRQLLRPDQLTRFDAAVTKALTDEGQ